MERVHLLYHNQYVPQEQRPGRPEFWFVWAQGRTRSAVDYEQEWDRVMRKGESEKSYVELRYSKQGEKLNANAQRISFHLFLFISTKE